MIRCGYCYTDNPEYETNCDFCDAPLNVERKVFRRNKKIDALDILYMNYFELKELNQVELLQLLNNTKEQLDLIVANEQPLATEKEIPKVKYLFQKKIHLLENLLFDLLGRVPRKTQTEVNKAKKSQASRIYTHNKNMTQKAVLPHHAFFKKRFF